MATDSRKSSGSEPLLHPHSEKMHLVWRRSRNLREELEEWGSCCHSNCPVSSVRRAAV